MPRPRPQATTPFGAWLDEWLTAHPEWTLDAFGAKVGTSKSAVSLWLSGTTKRPGIPRLRQIAELTGEPVDNLEQLVYGGDRPRAVVAPPAVSADLLDAIEERVRRVLDTRPVPTPIPTRDVSPWPLLVRLGRTAQGMSHGQLAVRMGANAHTVELWETGATMPTLRQQRDLIVLFAGIGAAGSEERPARRRATG